MHEEDNRENHGRGPIDLGAERSWEGRTATAVAKVERFVSGLFTLTSLDEAKAMMPSLPGSTGGQARRGYSRAFDEDNPSKQPLLVKVRTANQLLCCKEKASVYPVFHEFVPTEITPREDLACKGDDYCRDSQRGTRILLLSLRVNESIVVSDSVIYRYCSSLASRERT